jgi:hypothetical protein
MNMVDLKKARIEAGRIRTVVADFIEHNLEKKFKKLNVPTLTDIDKVVKKATARCDKEIGLIKKRYEKELNSIKVVIGEIIEVKNRVFLRRTTNSSNSSKKKVVVRRKAPVKKKV